MWYISIELSLMSRIQGLAPSIESRSIGRTGCRISDKGTGSKTLLRRQLTAWCGIIALTRSSGRSTGLGGWILLSGLACRRSRYIQAWPYRRWKLGTKIALYLFWGYRRTFKFPVVENQRLFARWCHETFDHLPFPTRKSPPFISCSQVIPWNLSLFKTDIVHTYSSQWGSKT